MNEKISISNGRRNFEMVAVLVTGLGRFLFVEFLDLRFLYISSACVFWIGYIFLRKKEMPQILSYWGLTFDNFKKTFLELLPLAIILSIAFYFIGNKLGTNILNINILPILLIYPIWGIIQQFIMIGIFARNLKGSDQIKLSTTGVVFVASLLFAIVHFPFQILVAATFLLAIVYNSLYLKGRNLLVMGIYHGWIGGLFFYTIMGRDPFLEVFGTNLF